ncbi:polysaccharide deacetylase family protein [Paenibacillus pasadenensis]|uniref:polysaccharide deacetylase family protein n=1 Tax=Paenibacillus pasadenensis TaxID=217090 RepID=UPI00203B4FDD|nr:polysaccharide deacetylase family protein [Paenibacillus pasadenensis]MCM3749298.1 polysaccharide deacetylase family protein [Paenibacillus pasadenensis]
MITRRNKCNDYSISGQNNSNTSVKPNPSSSVLPDRSAPKRRKWAGRLLLLPIAALLAFSSGCGQAGFVEAGGFKTNNGVVNTNESGTIKDAPNGQTGSENVVGDGDKAGSNPSNNDNSANSGSDSSNEVNHKANNNSSSNNGSQKPSVPNEGQVKGAHHKKGDKVVALTFDDGPDVEITGEILDILKKENVKATFFVVGTRVKQNPEMLKRIADEGHVIGNHSYNHPQLGKASRSKILDELNRTDKLIENAVGYKPKLMRPPYGSSSSLLRSILDETGRQQVLWSVDTRDWAGTSVKDMLANIDRNTKPGGNILMHSVGPKLKTPELLPLLIKDLRAKGYTFVTVDQLPS